MSEATAVAPAIPSFAEAFDQAVSTNTSPTEEPTLEAEVATQEQPKEQPPEEKGPEPALTPESSEDQLLSEEEYEALKDNPRALRKALNRAYTQYRQKNKPYEQLIEALQSDPAGTIKALAQEQGLQIQETKPVEQSPNTTELIRQHLAPELQFLADQLAPAFDAMLGKALQPIQQTVQFQEAARKVESDLAALTERHPDWRKYEARIGELGTILHPAVDNNGNPLTTEAEYLDTLYALATLPTSNAEATKRVVAQIKKSAENSESPQSGVSPDRVSSKPSGVPTMEQAFEAAKRGERW